MGLRELFGRLFLDTSDAENKIKDIDKKKDNINEEIDKSRIQLGALWSYSNQIMNLMLQQIGQLSKNAENQAKVQKAISITQVGQQEVAIAQTELQALAAFETGNIFSGVMLQTIVASMQVGLMVALANKATAEHTALLAKQMNNQIKTYSGSL